jgi:hypothetical protein
MGRSPYFEYLPEELSETTPFKSGLLRMSVQYSSITFSSISTVVE